jgi:hypothetical protein
MWNEQLLVSCELQSYSPMDGLYFPIHKYQLNYENALFRKYIYY